MGSSEPACAGPPFLTPPSHLQPTAQPWAELSKLVHCTLQGSFWVNTGVLDFCCKTAELSPSGQTLAVRGAAEPHFFPLIAQQQQLELERGTVLRDCRSTGAWAPCSMLYAFAPALDDRKRKREASTAVVVSVYRFGTTHVEQQLSYLMPESYEVEQLAWSPCSQHVAVSQGRYYTDLYILTPSTGALISQDVSRGVSPFAWAGHAAACRLLTVAPAMALQVHNFEDGQPLLICELQLVPIIESEPDACTVCPDDPENFALHATLDGSKVVFGCHGDGILWADVSVIQLDVQPPVVLGHRVFHEFEVLPSLSICVSVDLWSAASADEQKLFVLDFTCRILWASDGAAPSFSPCGTLLTVLQPTSVDMCRASTGKLVDSWCPADILGLSLGGASPSTSSFASETAENALWEMNELYNDTLHWRLSSGHIHLSSILRCGEDGCEAPFTGHYIYFAAVLSF